MFAAPSPSKHHPGSLRHKLATTSLQPTQLLSCRDCRMLTLLPGFLPVRYLSDTFTDSTQRTWHTTPQYFAAISSHPTARHAMPHHPADWRRDASYNRCDTNEFWLAGSGYTIEECVHHCDGSKYMTYSARGDRKCACQDECTKTARNPGLLMTASSASYESADDCDLYEFIRNLLQSLYLPRRDTPPYATSFSHHAAPQHTTPLHHAMFNHAPYIMPLHTTSLRHSTSPCK